MKKNTLLQFLVLSISVLSLFFLLSFATKMPASWRTPPKEISIMRSITAADLQKAFLAVNAEKIPLYIYIVKKSPDLEKNDLDLLFLSANTNKKTIPIGKPWTEAQFHQQCTWYVDYLKKKGLSADSATLVYHWVITKTSFKDQGNISVAVYPFHEIKNYIHFQKLVYGHTSNYTLPTTDSGCKYPPDCAMFFIPYSSLMKATVKKAFTK